MFEAVVEALATHIRRVASRENYKVKNVVYSAFLVVFCTGDV